MAVARNPLAVSKRVVLPLLITDDSHFFDVLIDTAGNLLQLKLRGMFKKADHDRIIQIAKEAIERRGRSP